MGLFLRQFAITAETLASASDHRINSMANEFHAGHEFIISGVIFLAIGTGFCAWSGWAYHQNRKAIEADRFEPAKLSVIVLTVVVVVGGLLLVGLVLWRTLGDDR